MYYWDIVIYNIVYDLFRGILDILSVISILY